jgi:hypothetical protein
MAYAGANSAAGRINAQRKIAEKHTQVILDAVSSRPVCPRVARVITASIIVVTVPTVSTWIAEVVSMT